jgi:hypothetical protein
MRRLPDDIKREVNRLAHALAQWSYGEHRRRLEVEALALLRAGHDQRDVLDRLTSRAARDALSEQYAHGCARAGD